MSRTVLRAAAGAVPAADSPIEPLAILLIGSVFGLIITGVVLAITSANDMVL
ncbi:General secretion pathway protein F / Type II secretory pathway, component PulF [Pseudomonas aeruginosa SCV20265]|nr:General secretion pathway protein F / Type II secretory pathway, component PulF [Pseudomonas aeruginosa SCV20265]